MPKVKKSIRGPGFPGPLNAFSGPISLILLLILILIVTGQKTSVSFSFLTFRSTAQFTRTVKARVMTAPMIHAM